MKTKLETIIEIKERIESEYKKHKSIDWAEIAANKIYATFSIILINALYAYQMIYLASI